MAQKQIRKNRQWDTRQFVPNGVDSINLPIGADVETLHLYFSGSITPAAGYTGVLSEGLAKLIKRLDLVLNGETIASMPGTALVHGNYARPGGIVKINPTVSAVAQFCEAVGFMDLAFVGGFRPKDSSLHTEGARGFQLRITWGAFTDMFVGPGSVTAYSLGLQVGVRETQEAPGAQLPELQRLYRFSEYLYSANKTDRIPLDPDVFYKGILLRSESNGDLSNQVINNVRVVVGSEILMDLPAAMLYDANTQDNEWVMPQGYYFVDFSPAPHGHSRFTDFLDLHGRNDAYLILDVNGGATNKVQLISHEFQALMDAAAHNQAVRG